MKICVITDNQYMYERFLELLEDSRYAGEQFDFFCSPGNTLSRNPELTAGCHGVNRGQLDLKKETELFFSRYDLFLSLHCKQVFPESLVAGHRCVNVHPGYNPHNRGWFPQVFGILNGQPVGATIHEMDGLLDHGPIIARRQVPVHGWDTSRDVYEKIRRAEVELLKEYLPVLLSGNYQTFLPEEEGEYHSQEEFQALCRLNPEETVTWGEALNLLRAMTYEGCKNAYYYDEEGRKVYVELRLDRE